MAPWGQTAVQDSQPVQRDGSETHTSGSSSSKTNLGQMRAHALQFVHLSSFITGMNTALTLLCCGLYAKLGIVRAGVQGENTHRRDSERSEREKSDKTAEAVDMPIHTESLSDRRHELTRQSTRLKCLQGSLVNRSQQRTITIWLCREHFVPDAFASALWSVFFPPGFSEAQSEIPLLSALCEMADVSCSDR